MISGFANLPGRRRVARAFWAINVVMIAALAAFALRGFIVGA